ncbi:MAG: methyl-accepting chemotaxis protein [Candidatus Eremiobacteraeota bacterium]|nr:methyl-accepting chemotaxis protein [Candidatus Eremiobacteraeota bacterium]MCW5872186.1 methyl-accepting chemotaxis protein [Candidatus Eremiobacteraeota bacterium]
MSQETHPSYAAKTLVRAGLLTIMALTALLVVAALWLGDQMNNQLAWTDHTHNVRSLLNHLERDLLEAESAERAYLYTGDEARLDDYNSVQNVSGKIEQLQTEVSDNREQVARMADLRQLVDAKLTFMARCISLKRNVHEMELRDLMATNTGVKLARDIHNKIAEMYGVEASLLEVRRGAVSRSQTGLNVLLLFGLGVELLVGFSILAFLGRRLAPLGPAAELAERIGSGDLTAEPLEVRVYDEVGRVNSNLNRMLENLRANADQNQAHADVVNQATARLAASTKEQAAALQQQSTALQQTSVTLEELSQSANQISDRSREVASRAEATAQAAGAGLESVRKSARSTAELVEQVQVVAERINALGEKTDAIRSIVLSVNDIAERSNVLALNAAILAAAAGSEGKGFTVVANEMKSLADQCKEATIQVRDLLGEVERGIQASVVLIEEAGRRGLAGSAFTDEASVSIHQLNSQVHDGTMAFSQIVAATSQQKLAFDQVSEALLSIRQASQQTTATTQQLEETTRELYRLSGQLVKSIESYRRKPGP